MKHFSLGLVFGLSAGVVLSLFKNKNGERLGQPLKDNIEETKLDAVNLQKNLAKAKDATGRLNEHIPSAQQAIDGIQTDIKNYQDHIKVGLNEFEFHAGQLENKLNKIDDDSKKK